jgi:hypothetical protein
MSQLLQVTNWLGIILSKINSLSLSQAIKDIVLDYIKKSFTTSPFSIFSQSLKIPTLPHRKGRKQIFLSISLSSFHKH